MLKFKYKDKSAIPAEHVAFYEERGGFWVLKVEGAVDADTHGEFRDGNISLKKEKERLEAELEAAKKENKTLSESPDKAAFAAKLKEQGEEHTRQTAALRQRADTAESNLSRERLNGRISEAARKAGVLEGSVVDVVNRARDSVRLNKEGGIEIVGDDGKPAYDANAQALNLDGWMSNLAKSGAPHLFGSNNGSGASGSRGGGAPFAGPNPFAKASENMTEQAKLIKADPAQARQLAQAAGFPVDW